MMVLALMLLLTLLENRKLIVTIKYYRELSFTMKRKMLPLEMRIVIRGELEENAKRDNNIIFRWRTLEQYVNFNADG